MHNHAQAGDEAGNNPFGDQYQNPYQASSYAPRDMPDADVVIDRETRQWATALHLSQFAGYAIPFGGFVIPLLIWLLKRDSLPGIDAHGREVMNWILSELVYGLIFFLMIFILVGIPLLVLLGIVGVVFPVIAAIKASDGIQWRYPMSIRFF